MNIKVKIRLYTSLKKYSIKLNQDSTLVLNKKITLEDLSRYLEIPEDLGRVYLVDKFPKEKDYFLKDGDEVKIFPFLGGG